MPSSPARTTAARNLLPNGPVAPDGVGDGRIAGGADAGRVAAVERQDEDAITTNPREGGGVGIGAAAPS